MVAAFHCRLCSSLFLFSHIYHLHYFDLLRGYFDACGNGVPTLPAGVLPLMPLRKETAYIFSVCKSVQTAAELPRSAPGVLCQVMPAAAVPWIPFSTPPLVPYPPFDFAILCIKGRHVPQIKGPCKFSLPLPYKRNYQQIIAAFQKTYKGRYSIFYLPTPVPLLVNAVILWRGFNLVTPLLLCSKSERCPCFSAMDTAVLYTILIVNYGHCCP